MEFEQGLVRADAFNTKCVCGESGFSDNCHSRILFRGNCRTLSPYRLTPDTRIWISLMEFCYFLLEMFEQTKIILDLD